MDRSALECFVDELIKLSADSTTNKLFKATANDKLTASRKKKSRLGNMWRQGSPLSTTGDKQEISRPYDRAGAAAQVGSFSAQSSEADSESGTIA